MKDEAIERMKDSIDLREIIKLPGDGGRRSGAYLHGYCPFHESSGGADHSTPSFMVYARDYRCLSPKCQEHGDVFNWFAWTLYGDKGGPVSGAAFKSIKQHLLDNYMRGVSPAPAPKEVGKKIKLSDGERSKLLNLAYACHKNLGSMGLTYFIGRGFTLQTIRRQLFGFDGQRFTLPIWKGIPRQSKLLTIRFRRADGTNDDGPRYSGIKNINDQMLFNREALLWSIKHFARGLLIFYGELDAGLAWQDGLPAVSPTNGALSFLPEWVARYPGYKIFVPDKGEERAAYADAEMFGTWGAVAHLPRGSFKDYGEFRQAGRTPREMIRCIKRDTGVLLTRRIWQSQS